MVHIQWTMAPVGRKSRPGRDRANIFNAIAPDLSRCVWRGRALHIYKHRRWFVRSVGSWPQHLQRRTRR
jgi:hypothetical protein